MKAAIQLLCTVLAAAHYLRPVDGAVCANVPVYTTELVPVCTTSDNGLMLPNYADAQKYYQCDMDVVTEKSCSINQFFNYVLQACSSCASYIPAPPCEALKTQSPPNCVPIGSGGTTASTPSAGTPSAGTPSAGTPSSPSSLPTPIYPDTTTTVVTDAPTESTTVTVTVPPTESTTVITPPTASTESTTKGGITVPTAPTPADTTVNTKFPTAPTETTKNDVPTPPTPPATPPVVTPPTISRLN